MFTIFHLSFQSNLEKKCGLEPGCKQCPLVVPSFLFSLISQYPTLFSCLVQERRFRTTLNQARKAQDRVEENKKRKTQTFTYENTAENLQECLFRRNCGHFFILSQSFLRMSLNKSLSRPKCTLGDSDAESRKVFNLPPDKKPLAENLPHLPIKNRRASGLAKDFPLF